MRQTLRCALVLFFAFMFVACSGDEQAPTQPVTGIISGTITDAQTSLALAGVRIVVFDANTNAPIGAPGFTDNQGNFSFDLSPGTYQLKLARQGYEEIPPRGISPISLNVTAGQTTTYSVTMFESSVTNAGLISGTVTVSGAPIGGVLVVADESTSGFSSVSATDGSFAIYNLPPNTYLVTAWQTGYNSTESTIVVGSNAIIQNVNLVLSVATGGSVSGQITFLATTNIEVDVALTHPLTRETIPGLNMMTVNRGYALTNVPNGTYLARASYANDSKVIDPDWIIKNGEPFVTVSGGPVTRDFSVTGAVELLSPTNPPTNTQPVITGTVPLFSWESYPSASHYVVEVINSQGTVIWGGFESNWTVRRVLIPSSETSIQFDADSTASESLVPGKVYRWKIYASKDDAQEPLGWKLISQSEEQRGLITIAP